MFPNEQGVYLHDTNEKALLRGGERLFSAGCVRVEDAPRLARWLFGRPVPLTGTQPERRVDLPGAVPVYLTYLTASAVDGKLVFRDDVYGRDDAGGGYRTR
jgi:murein L,D-transpeptidase YcbB/YkuD